MDIIHLLPDSVANQIAAGEVIQRPSSVIKELMENAVDAGARHIDVLVVDAGRTSIQVIDDGKGMSETDARLAFERHATSKIQQATDLFSLHTMGFRGEALPSIAAVAQITLRTRAKDSELGTCLSVEGSRIVSQEVDACPVGANFLVQNLFYNVPARRKFLKSNQTELSNIVQEFERIALVNPDIAFTLTHNEALVTNLPSSSLRQRIISVFGKRIGDQVLNVDVDTTICHLYGFVGRPDSARKKGAHQYFYVNGRYMRHPYFHKAVQEAFNGLIPPTEQVPYFLYFEVDPSDIDVNIHPTKTEIKFENDGAIWQIILAAVKEALGRFNAVPTIDFDTEGRPDIPPYDPSRQQPLHSPGVDVDTSYNPFRQTPSSTASSRSSSSSNVGGHQDVPLHAVHPKRSQVEWESLYAGLEKVDGGVMDEIDSGGEPSNLPKESSLFSADENKAMETSSHHFQLHGQYILTAVQDGLMIVDQHRAHVRVLYDKYIAQMKRRAGVSQGLLFPEMLQLPSSDSITLEKLLPDLKNLGFDISPLGGGSYSIQGVPSEIDGLDITGLIKEFVASSVEKGGDVTDELRHRLALTLARRTSICVGEYLGNDEMKTLLSNLFDTQIPNFSPDGHPIIAVLRAEDIKKLFK